LVVIAVTAVPSGQQQQPPAQPQGQPQQPPAQQPTPPPATTSQGQPPQTGQQPPVIRRGINYVSVDVIVTDKKTGNPVLDLNKDDFEVREDKKPQVVQTFDVVKIDAIPEDAVAPAEIKSTYDEEREAKRADVRLFVLLLDDYHVRRGNDMVVKKPLIDFVQNQLGPQDMVAVMYPMTPVDGITFTRNKSSIIDAINHFEGRKGIYEPRNEFEERYAYYPVAQVEQIRNDLSMGALKAAAVRMGGMREGRKSILFVSEGFTSSVPAQLNDPVAALPGYGNPYRGSPGTDPAMTQRQQAGEFFDEVDLDTRLKEVYDTVNRNNTSIYAVDPRGLAVFEYGIESGVSQSTDRKVLTQSLDTLRVLADNTDGRAIVNRNDLATGMKQIMRDASGYYLLGYTSSAGPTDGKFHTIDVRVKRPGVDVRARKGYWAYSTEDVARATAPPKPGPAPAVASALNAIVEPTRGHAARFWVGIDKGTNGESRVTFVWEPIGANRPDAADRALPTRVRLTATAPDGKPVFRGNVPETLGVDPLPPKDGDGAPVSLRPATSATFDAPPGPLELRMVVEGPRGQVVDSSARDITVPDFSKTQVSISTPRVYRARTAYEMLAVRKNPDAAPTADRAFSRTERLLVRFSAYGAAAAQPEVTARLLNRAGQKMADVPVTVVPPGLQQIEFPLSSLAAGEYLLEINAKTASGSAQELVAFRVGA
jgi:VWFA-related protein